MKRALMGASLGVALALLSPFAAMAGDDKPPTPFIVVDQIGYLPDQPKVAVVRDPEIGFDNDWRFTPGSVYQVIDTQTQAVVLEGAPIAWNKGKIDPLSGDHAWTFDFSVLTTPGTYLIRDKQAGYDSVSFKIAPNVYRTELVQAVRMLYYQRANIVREARFAGANWADTLDHMGPGQDSEARLYSQKGDKSTARDLRGGWFDAGDYNKYTAWTASYVIALLSTYAERPEIWTDDFNIPESGNGVPDLLDEVKWGVDWLARMQTADGGVLSVLGLAGGSPPSAAHGPSYYGPASTAATYGAAGAYAYAAKIYGAGDPRFAGFSTDMKARAIQAWNWAQAHPNVTFYNNDPRDHSEGLAAGQQEPDDYGRQMKALAAAIYLYDLTGDAVYRDYVDGHYRQNSMYKRAFTQDADYDQTAPLLYYAHLSGATPAVAADIRRTFAAGYEKSGWQALASDPYQAPVSGYWWGSNGIKASAGNIFAEEARYGLSAHSSKAAMAAAAGYIHYINGVNPLGKVYLSNMGGLGVQASVDRFYHTWYAHGSAWDSASHSKYGPPPGYLVGGPNPTYNWDSRCPDIHPGCGRLPLSPPVGQPAQKAYADFNEAWPINSWEVTEPSLGYQTAYIRLLARFVR